MRRQRVRALAAGLVFTAVAARFAIWAADDTRHQAGGARDNPVLPSLVLRSVPDAGGFTAILRRPLFREDRRAPVEPSRVEAAAASEAPPPPVTGVIAVAIGPDRRAAILQLGAGGTSVLMQGEQTAGWTLAEIAADHVTLRDGPREARFFLPADGNHR